MAKKKYPSDINRHPQLQVRLSPELDKAVTVSASTNGVTVPEFVREVLTEVTQNGSLELMEPAH